MKHRKLYTIALIVIMAATVFTSFPYRPVILLILATAVMVNHINTIKLYSERDTEGDLLIRRQKYPINIGFIILAFIWTMLVVFGKRLDIYYVLFFWMAPVANGITAFYYKRRKPVYIIIQKKDFIINDIWPIRRNIDAISGIRLNGFTNKLRIAFSGQTDLIFNTEEFKKDDLTELIYTLRGLCQQEIKISENVIDKDRSELFDRHNQ